MTIISQPFAGININSANTVDSVSVGGKTTIIAPPVTGGDGQVVFLANWETNIGSLPPFDDTGLQTLTGDTLVGTVNPKFGIGALEGDGIMDTLITTANATLMDIRVATRSWTLETWIRFNSGGDNFPGTARDISIIRQRNNPGAYFWELIHGATNSSPRTLRIVENMDGIGSRTTVFTSPQLISVDTYFHIALVNDAGLWTLFVEGVPQATATPNLVWLGTVDADHFGLAIIPDFFSSNIFDSQRYTMDEAIYTGPFTPIGPLTA